MINKRGFTLIELLVVIAIIGILSSVVLASLNSARDKGSNAAVKANLQGIRSQAAIVYDDNNQDYTNVCSDPNVVNAINKAITAGGDTGDVATRCNSTTDAWAVNVQLKNAPDAEDFWCVDSESKAVAIPDDLADGVYICS